MRFSPNPIVRQSTIISTRPCSNAINCGSGVCLRPLACTVNPPNPRSFRPATHMVQPRPRIQICEMAHFHPPSRRRVINSRFRNPITAAASYSGSELTIHRPRSRPATLFLIGPYKRDAYHSHELRIQPYNHATAGNHQAHSNTPPDQPSLNLREDIGGAILCV